MKTEDRIKKLENAQILLHKAQQLIDSALTDTPYTLPHYNVVQTFLRRINADCLSWHGSSTANIKTIIYQMKR